MILHKSTTHKNETSKGFTLIEMLVAVGLFSIVMVVVVGALVSLIDANKKARSQKTAINNINSALENISRDVREGSNYTLLTSSMFAYTASDGRNVIYALSNDNRIIRSVDGEAFQPITSEGLIIDHLEFEATVDPANPSLQPLILITVNGETIDKERVRSQFNVQTSISQRYRIAFDESFISDVPPNAVCPFQPRPGRYIINFEEIRPNRLLCNQDYDWSSLGYGFCYHTRPYPLSAAEEVPPGTYNIGLAGWEPHCTEDRDCTTGFNHGIQEHEMIFAEVYDVEGGTMMYRTDPTPSDIPTTVNIVLPPEFVAFNVTIPRTITHVLARHALQHPTYSWTLAPGEDIINSVVPACMVFDIVGTGGDVEITPF